MSPGILRNSIFLQERAVPIHCIPVEAMQRERPTSQDSRTVRVADRGSAFIWLLVFSMAVWSGRSAAQEAETEDEAEEAEKAEQREEGQAFDWDVVAIDGLDYVSDENVAKFYSFEKFDRSEGRASFRHHATVMDWDLAKPEIRIREVRFHLIFPLLERDGRLLLSAVDLAKLVDPVVRPSYIAGAGEVSTVVVDPAFREGTPEVVDGSGESKDLTLALAEALREELAALDFKTVLTRSDGSEVSVEEKQEIANSENRAVFIRIDFKTEGSESDVGIETATLAPQGTSPTRGGEPADEPMPGNVRDAHNIALAAAVHSYVIDRGRGMDEGVTRVSSELLGGLEIPAIEIYLGSLSNQKHAERLNDADYRQEIAKGIAYGLGNYQWATRVR